MCVKVGNDRSPLRTWIQRLLPWLISALVVAALLRRYRLADIVQAMRQGHPGPMLPVIATFAAVQILIVTLWDTMVLRSVLGPLRYRDVLRVKAGCAMLLTVAYVANQGAYAVWIARATGTRPRNAASLVLFTTASDLTAGCLLVTGSIWLGGASAPDWLRFGAPITAGIILSLMALPPRRSIDARAESSLVRVWQAVPRERGLPQVFARLINFSLIVLASWGASRAFGLVIPLQVMFMYGPVVTVIGSLPVNVAGMGVVQGAWLLFLPWATGPQILAFQLIYSVMLGGCIVLRGLPFVRRVVAEVAAGKMEEEAHRSIAIPISGSSR